MLFAKQRTGTNTHTLNTTFTYKYLWVTLHKSKSKSGSNCAKGPSCHWFCNQSFPKAHGFMLNTYFIIYYLNIFNCYIYAVLHFGKKKTTSLLHNYFYLWKINLPEVSDDSTMFRVSVFSSSYSKVSWPLASRVGCNIKYFLKTFPVYYCTVNAL